MLELYSKFAQSFNDLYHWVQDMNQQMKDLIENLETASEALDHQEAPIKPIADLATESLMPLVDLPAAD